MKRFLFWFVAALFALVWLRSARQSDPPVATVVRLDARGPERGGPVVYIDERGVAVDGDSRAALPDVFPVDRVYAEGLPVPVVPGTRVTEARAEPPQRPQANRPQRVRPRPEGQRVRPRVETAPQPRSGLKEIEGRLSATEDRARRDARERLERELADLLAPEVPRDWKVPAPLVDGLIREVTIKPVVRDYGTLYQATLAVDLSPSARAGVVGAYRHEQVVKRLVVLGTLLAFVLVCLAAVSGYIKADEATRGYYTNKLRLAAAAGVGAVGVVIYRMLV